MLSGSSGVPGGSSGFSTKLADPAGVVGVDATERVASLRGTRMPATVAPAPLSMWNCDHLLGVHPVHVIGAENDDVVGVFVVDQVQRLIDRVGRAGVPARAQALLGRHRGDVLAGQTGQPPVLRDVAVQ